ncbi:MAG: tagatose 1,6-diphosphate aldolase, partial [Deltaproteobacteria bacterium]|nr:tagatose 1,6-diphosphate aldolase [Deltaproteobacteria bacterium]
AKRKPEIVRKSMEEFSKPRYNVDVLKVEIPVNMEWVGEGKAYTKEEAKQHFRKAAAATTKPFIYLSAGVSDDVFRASLELAMEAGVKFNGVLCGRATWKEGIPVYAKEGVKALEAWLSDRGVKNIQALNAILERGAAPVSL